MTAVLRFDVELGDFGERDILREVRDDAQAEQACRLDIDEGEQHLLAGRHRVDAGLGLIGSHD